jgi:hypothetical protein
MIYEELDEKATKEIVDITDKILDFLDQNISRGKYSHINMALNVLTSTLFRISETYLPDLKSKKEFAVHVAKMLILNYENTQKNK